MPAEEGLGFALNPGGDAQAAETDRDMAGNVQDRKMPDPHGEFVLPGGATAFQNIPYEGILETVDQPPPPEVVAKPTIPGPQYAPQGSSGGIPLFLTTTAEESQPALVPQQQPGQPPTGVASDPLQPQAFAVEINTISTPDEPPPDTPPAEFDPLPVRLLLDQSLGEDPEDDRFSDGTADADDSEVSPPAQIALVPLSDLFDTGEADVTDAVYRFTDIPLIGLSTGLSVIGDEFKSVPLYLYSRNNESLYISPARIPDVDTDDSDAVLFLRLEGQNLTVELNVDGDYSLEHPDPGRYDEPVFLDLPEGSVYIQLESSAGTGSFPLDSSIFTLRIEDDGPAAGVFDAEVATPDLDLQTGDGGLDDGNDKALPATETSGDLDDAFIAAVTPDYGADSDAPPATVSIVATDADDGFSFTLAGSDTALNGAVDTGLDLSDASNTSVYAYLSSDGRTIYGRDSAGGFDQGNAVFELSINQLTGAITQTQYQAFDHSVITDGTGTTGVEPLEGGDVTAGTYSTTPPDSVNLGALEITISAQVRTTDADGDYTDQTVESEDIASGFVFYDDGPAISDISEVTSTAVLETDDGGLSGGNAGGDTSDSTDYSGVFRAAAGTDYGADSGSNASVSSSGFDLELQVVEGTQAKGSINDPSATDQSLTSGNEAVYLYTLNANTIVGSTLTSTEWDALADQADTSAGEYVFRVQTTDAGVVTLNQYEEIDHLPTDGASSDYADQTWTLDDGQIHLTGTVTVTDNDTDTAADSDGYLDLGGNLRITDDGPAISDISEVTSTAVLETDDGGLSGGNAGGDTSDSTDYSGVFRAAAGTDYGADSGSNASVSSSGFDLELQVVEGTQAKGSINDPSATDQSLTSGNEAVYLYTLNANTIVGSTLTSTEWDALADQTDTSAGEYVFRVQTTDAGVVTLNQYEEIDHLPTDGASSDYADQTWTLDDGQIHLTGTVTVTDNDTDTAADSDGYLDLGGNLRITDDGPAISDISEVTSTAVLETDDGGLSGGNAGGDTSDSTDYSGVFRAAAGTDYGADSGSNASVSSSGFDLELQVVEGTQAKGSINDPSATDQSLTSGNEAVYLYTLNANTIVGSTLTSTEWDALADQTDTSAGEYVFRVQTTDAGVVTLNQYEEIDHLPTDGASSDYADQTWTLDDGQIHLTGTVTVTDNDTDTAADSDGYLDLGGNLRITDDGPAISDISEVTSTAVLETDDGGLSGGNAGGDTSDSTDYSGVFRAAAGTDYGADSGSNASVSSSGFDLELQVVEGTQAKGSINDPSATDQSLTSGNEAVYLYTLNANTIVGSTLTSTEWDALADQTDTSAGEYVFRVQTTDAGVVTLNQYEEIDHLPTDGASSDYADQTWTLDDGQIHLTGTVTVTDNDTDTAADSDGYLDLGGNLRITDDGPAISDISEVTSTAVLETDDGGLSGGNAGGDTSDSTDYSGVFRAAAGTDYGADSGSNASVSSSGFDLELQVVEGTQAKGSINDPSATDQSLTSGNEAVYLYTLNANTIVGSTLTSTEWDALADQTDTSAGEYVFRVQTTDAGVVTLNQYEEIDHLPTDGASSDYADQTWTLDDGQIHLTGTVTVTDNDTDTAADSDGYLDLGGNLRITDDGPAISDISEVTSTAVLETDDGGLSGGNAGGDTSDSTDYSGVFRAAAGTDYGADSGSNASVSSSGFDLELQVVEGTQAKGSINDPSATDQSLTSGNEAVYLYTLNANTIVGSTLTSTEWDALADQTDTSAGEYVFRVQTTDAGVVTLNQYEEIDHLPTDGASSDYADQTWTLDDGQIHLTGTVTVTDNDTDTAADSDGYLDLGGNLRITDDGPAISDISEVTSTAVLETDDGGLSGGNAGGDTSDSTDYSGVFRAAAGTDYGADSGSNASVSSSGFDLELQVVEGTQAKGSINDPSATDQSLTSGNEAVYLYTLNANTIVGSTLTSTEWDALADQTDTSAGEYVFRVQTTDAGVVTLNQYEEIDHLPTDGASSDYADQTWTLDDGQIHLTGTVTVTDNDTDTAADSDGYLDLGGNLRITDDGPAISDISEVTSTAVLETDDGGLSGGNAGGDTSDSTDYSGVFRAAAGTDYGADSGSNASVSSSGFDLELQVVEGTQAKGSINDPSATDQSLTSGNEAVYLYTLNANTIVGSTLTSTEWDALADQTDTSAGEYVFRVQTTDAGVVTLNQYEEIDHLPTDGASSDYADQTWTLDDGQIHLTGTVTVTDNDTDTAADSDGYLDLGGNLRITDDGPAISDISEVTSTAVLETDDGGLSGGNAGGDTSDSTDYSGVFRAAAGTDYGADSGSNASVSSSGFDLELQVVEGTQAKGSINDPSATDQSLTSGNEAVYLYTLNANTIVGSTLTSTEWDALADQTDTSAGEYVFRVQTTDAGVVTLNQYEEIDHLPTDGASSDYADQTWTLDDGQIHLTGTVTVTDNDTDTAADSDGYLDLGGNLRITDDGPAISDISEVTSTAVLETDDGGLSGGNAGGDTSDSTDYSGVFRAAAGTDYGADSGSNASVSSSGFDLELQVVEGTQAKGSINDPSATDQSLTSGNEAVYLYTLNANTIVGSTLTSTEWDALADQTDTSAGEYVFRVQTTDAGVVTLNQYEEIDHLPTDGASSDYADQTWTLDDGQIHLTGTVTVTDNDTDTAADSDGYLDLGGNLRITDDGPAISDISEVTSTAVLETDDGGLSGGNAGGDTSDSTDYSGVFRAAAGTDYGADSGSNASVSSSGFDLELQVVEGTQAKGSINDPSATDQSLTSGNEAVYLYTLNANTIVGSTLTSTEWDALADQTDTSAGEYVFRVQTTDAGVVTLNQYAEIDHLPTDGASSDYADQTWTLDDGQIHLTGTVTVTDNDTDTAADSDGYLDLGGNLRITDDGPAISDISEVTSTAVLETDDGGLSGGNAGGDTSDSTDYSGVFRAAAGTDYGADSGSNASVSSSGFDLELQVVEGTQAKGSINDPSATDQSLTSGNEAVYLYTLNANTIVGSTLTSTEWDALADQTDTSAGEYVFRVQTTDAGVVTLNQYAEIDHLPTDGASSDYADQTWTLDDGQIHLTGTVTVTDNDTDTAADSDGYLDLGGNLRITDDGPAMSPLSTVTLTAPYNSSATPVLWDGYQFFDWSYGADLVSPLLSAASIDVSLTSSTSTAFSISNILYGGDYDFSFDVYYDNGVASSLVSSVYLDADGPDSIEVYSLPTEKVLVDVDSLTPAAGGPQPAYEYLDINSAGLDLVVTGSGDVNNSSNGWAVGGNQNINPGEFITFSYFSDYGLVDPATPEYVTDFEFQTSKYTGGISTATLAVEVFYSDGSVGFWIVSGVLEGATITIDDSGIVAVNPNPGDPSPTVTTGSGHTVTDYTLLYREVDIQYIGDKGGLNLTDAAFNTYEQNADGLTFAVNIAPIDFDSDTAVETLTVVLEGTDGTSDELDVSVGPVVLDLDRDSLVEYLHLEYNAAPFSLSILPLAAWVSPEDGLLVYDYNTDGLIAEAKEFVFTMWGDDPDVLTDMQALAAYFDSNGDGLLDASDHAWQSFGVWQDLNIDGIQQEGEFYGLDYWGIESIALDYDADSAPYTAADGDVQVYGQMTVTYDDGSTGLAEDVAFAVASVDQPEASLEPIVVDSSALSSVQDLVSSYLESMHTTGDLDGNGDLSQAEMATGLDLAVSDYLDANALSADAYGEIEQEVFNVLAEQINDLDPDSPVDIQIDDQGNADGADLIAALDQTFDDLMLLDSPEALDLVPVASEYG